MSENSGQFTIHSFPEPWVMSGSCLLCLTSRQKPKPMLTLKWVCVVLSIFTIGNILWPTYHASVLTWYTGSCVCISFCYSHMSHWNNRKSILSPYSTIRVKCWSWPLPFGVIQMAIKCTEFGREQHHLFKKKRSHSGYRTTMSTHISSQTDKIITDAVATHLTASPLMMQRCTNSNIKNGRDKDRGKMEWQADRRTCGAAWASDRQTYWVRLYHEPFDGRFHPEHLTAAGVNTVHLTWVGTEPLKPGRSCCWVPCRSHQAAEPLTDRQTGHTGRQTDRRVEKTDRQTDRKAERQAGWVSDGCTASHAFMFSCQISLTENQWRCTLMETRSNAENGEAAYAVYWSRL